MDSIFDFHFDEEFTNRTVKISVMEMGEIVSRNIAKVIEPEKLLDSDGSEFESQLLMLKLLTKFCSNIMDDMFTMSELIIEEDEDGEA